MEAEIEELIVEQQEAETKNDVEVDIIRRTQVGKVAKTILDTNTMTLKTETTNKFKKQTR